MQAKVVEDAQLSIYVRSISHQQVRNSQCLEAVDSTLNANTTNPSRTIRLSVTTLKRFWSFPWCRQGPPLARGGDLAPAGVAACVCEPGELAQVQRLQICPSTVARKCSDANIRTTSCGKREGAQIMEKGTPCRVRCWTCHDALMNTGLRDSRLVTTGGIRGEGGGGWTWRTIEPSFNFCFWSVACLANIGA